MIRVAVFIAAVMVAGACQQAEREPAREQEMMESTEMMGDSAETMMDDGHMMAGDTAHKM